MKNTFFISILLLSIYSFGQVKFEKVNELEITENKINIEKDTIIKIVYKNEVENNKKPAFFVNEQLVNESIFKSINPNQIENINVEKIDIEIENVKYYGKINIFTKSNYNPEFISLNNLKNKYIKTKTNEVIFKINDKIIHTDYDKYIVDEKNVLRLIVENYEKDNLKISFIHIVTKTEENIKKSKEIRIRGNNKITLNMEQQIREF